DLGRAVVAERLREVVGDVLADHDGVCLEADVLRALGRLGDGTERGRVEGALVVEDVRQDRAHPRSFLSSSQATTFSTVSTVSSPYSPWRSQTSRPSSTSILMTCVSDGISRWSATTAPIV